MGICSRGCPIHWYGEEIEGSECACHEAYRPDCVVESDPDRAAAIERARDYITRMEESGFMVEPLKALLALAEEE